MSDRLPEHTLVQLPGTVVAPGSAERLAAALAADTTIATASALPGPQSRVGPETGPLPRLAAPVPGLVLVRREAMDLVAGEPEDRLAAVAQAASAVAMQHVLVPEVVVEAPGAPADPDAGEGVESPVARALRAAERATRPLTVTIDLRCLNAPLGGTQVHALEAAAALARRPELELRLLLPPVTHPSARDALGRIGAAGRIGMDEVEAAVERSEPLRCDDVFHRPFQVTAPADLGVAELLGTRLTVTHQDLIAYRAAHYHPRPEEWRAFRRTTRLALARADAVLFESEHARADALADGLVEPHVTGLAPIGVDHTLLAEDPEPARPGALPDDGRPFLLVLGTDYAHKQRPFALRLAAAMNERGWGGRVVLAGPHVQAGGTAASERLGPDDLDLGPVDAAERAWLYANAAAVAYPTTYEGFGLIPFEAAAHGKPCLFAPVASLGELMAGVDGALVPWDAAASAERVLALLAAPAEQVDAIRARAAELTWDRYAERLLVAFRAALAAPQRPAARAARDALAAEAQRGHWEGSYWHLSNAIGPAGHALVGLDAPLLGERERRGLAALARRPLTAAPLRRLLRLVARG